MQMFGYPADNFYKDLQAVHVNFFRVFGQSKYEAEYEAKRAYSAVNSNNKSQYMDILYRAFDNDKKAYNRLYTKYVNDEGFATSKQTSREYVYGKVAKHAKEKQKEANRSKVGLTQKDIDKYEAALDKYDTDKNGSASKEEIYNALMSIDLSMKQKNALWNEKGYTQDKKPQSISQYEEQLAKKKK